MKKKIFIIDDEPNIRTMLNEVLKAEGFEVDVFPCAEQALEKLDTEAPELMITDMVMPQMSGLQLIQKVKAIKPETNIILITAYATVESAVTALKSGACDYLIKPFRVEELLQSIQKALSQKRVIPEISGIEATVLPKYGLENLIGKTEPMKKIYELIKKVAKTDSSVLIMGESGTGKEMVARAIHYLSKRKAHPFVSINCAALPETLLESELFGYEKGAFTGAHAMKVGLFELAEKGTFLLDEVGEMSVALQVKLLRVLQERVLKRLGGVRDLPVNFRLIAATSKNLLEEMKGKRFREDLYYRLNVIPIVIPPLRERTEDIPLLVDHFMKRLGRKSKTPVLTSDALDVFKGYSWPGNVRELENVVERIVALTESDHIGAEAAKEALESGNLSPGPVQSIYKDNLRESVDTYERAVIEKTLAECEGNQNQAAKKLKLSRQALHYKIKKYGIAIT